MYFHSLLSGDGVQGLWPAFLAWCHAAVLAAPPPQALEGQLPAASQESIARLRCSQWEPLTRGIDLWGQGARPVPDVTAGGS